MKQLIFLTIIINILSLNGMANMPHEMTENVTEKIDLASSEASGVLGLARMVTKIIISRQLKNTKQPMNNHV